MDARVAQNAPQIIYAKDYRPPEFLVDNVALDFDLFETETKVVSRLKLRRNGAHDAPLTLMGEDIKLLSVKLNGVALDNGAYRLTETGLKLPGVPDEFELEIVTEVNAEANTELSGLYLSGGNFCTQCEAEGFRRITFFPDRPDVMARYETTLRADKARYPVLLSNGNLVDSGDDAHGRHWARWVDPYLKPSYLFALVAGDLKALRDNFTTKSGREVALNIYVAEADLPKCGHAMEALKNSMRWDEDVYGREYDLDIYNIVAVSDFNMGAMENKGLNVFNTRYVLASPDTATDADFDHVEGVIAHEYFHNWTGNRVTCRDWFQLSLKEGLTVFRDQEFSADQSSRALKRIDDVRVLRAVQFPEDAGPLAHPVRPDSYIEINNFYTPTVYNKGAEVIRMIHALLGEEKFRKGMDLYFERHDGEAVTCDDFVAAMADASGLDLSHFKLWYAQAGTPKVAARYDYDAEHQRLTLHLRQNTPETPGQKTKEALLIPIRTALIGASGDALPVQYNGRQDVEHMLLLDNADKSFTFEGVAEKAVPSLLRGFSAPVILEAGLSVSDLAFLARHDNDPFNRWEAFQTLATHFALEQVEKWQAGEGVETNATLIEAIAATLADQSLDPAYVAEAITLPSEAVLADKMAVADVEAVHAVRQAFRKDIGQALNAQFEATYHANTGFDGLTPSDKGRRKLKNAALAYLMAQQNSASVALAFQQFEAAANMTDELAALALLSHSAYGERQIALDLFYAKWRHEALVLDKWFSIQAQSSLDDTLDRVKALIHHPDFTRQNPNRLRSLIGAFAHGNQLRFHAADGSGYKLLADEVLAVDRLNPQTAARLLGPLGRWRRVDEGRAAKMRAELQRVVDSAGVSKDVFEIASKSLG